MTVEISQGEIFTDFMDQRKHMKNINIPMRIRVTSSTQCKTEKLGMRLGFKTLLSTSNTHFQMCT